MNKEDTIRELRFKNNEKIIEHRELGIDWDRFKELIMRVPGDLDNTKKKIPLQPKDRLNFETRDRGHCYICRSTFPYGSSNVYLYTTMNYKLSHLHHIIPNGGIEDKNIVTLCTHCHQLVHQALYIEGIWKYGRPL